MHAYMKRCPTAFLSCLPHFFGVCRSTPLSSLTQMRKSQCLNYKSGGPDQDRVLFQQVKGDKVTERLRNNINSFWSTLGNGSLFKTETVTTNSILTDLDVVLLLYLQNIMKGFTLSDDLSSALSLFSFSHSAFGRFLC